MGKTIIGEEAFSKILNNTTAEAKQQHMTISGASTGSSILTL